MTESETKKAPEETESRENDEAQTHESETTESAISNPSDDSHKESEQKPSPTEQLIIDFCHDLSQKIQPDRKPYFYASEKGVFFTEQDLESVRIYFREWYQEKSGKSIPPERIDIKIFQQSPPDPYYILKGKTPVPGYLLACQLERPSTTGLTIYQGRPLDTKTSLHPADPIFHTLEGVHSITGKSGQEIKIDRGEKSFTCSPLFLRNFSDAIKMSDKLQKRFPGATRSLRYTLPALVQIMREARPLQKKSFLFTPAQIAKSKENLFYRIANLIIVSSQAGELIACFAGAGDGYRKMIRNEFDQLLSRKNRVRIGDTEIWRRDRKGTCGSFEMHKIQYKLQHRPLMKFIESFEPRFSDREFPGRYTIHDCIKKMVVSLRKAEILDHRRIPPEIKRLYKGQMTYRRADGFFYVFDDRWTLVGCFANRARPPHQNRKRRNENGKSAQKKRVER